MARRNILLFGINYAPEQLGIAPYTTGLAEHLVEAGHDVTVVSGFPHYPQWQVARERRFRRSITEVINGVRVVRRRNYVPSSPSAVRRGIYELTFFGHALPETSGRRPDVILGVSPSVSGALLAATAGARLGVPFGLWFQDLSGRAAAQSGIAGGKRVAKAAERLELFAARRSALVGVISAGFGRRLIDLGVDASRIRTTRNWSHIHASSLDKAAARDAMGLPQDAFVLLHAGNMGQKQGLKNVIDAATLAARNGDSPLFLLQGDGNSRRVLEEQARGLRNLRFLPPLPDQQYSNALAAADVLLVSQKPQITDMCLPGKLTSYFAAGRPVLAAVNQVSEAAIELRRTEAGYLVNPGDPAAMLAALTTLRNDPALCESLAANGLRHAEQELTSEAALANLEAFVEEIATSRSPQVSPSAARAAGHAD